MSLAVVAEPIPLPSRAWTDAALCRGKTHLFFGPPRERPGRRTAREHLARSYCSLCPVSIDCRSAGRSNHENGLWAGENEEDRAALGYGPRHNERRSVAAAAREAPVLSCVH